MKQCTYLCYRVVIGKVKVLFQTILHSFISLSWNASTWHFSAVKLWSPKCSSNWITPKFFNNVKFFQQWKSPYKSIQSFSINNSQDNLPDTFAHLTDVWVGKYYFLTRPPFEVDLQNTDAEFMLCLLSYISGLKLC